MKNFFENFNINLTDLLHLALLARLVHLDQWEPLEFLVKLDNLADQEDKGLQDLMVRLNIPNYILI